jgi:hypothetical protein
VRVPAGVMMTAVVMALLVVIAIVERLRGGNRQHQYRECGCKKLHMILPWVFRRPESAISVINPLRVIGLNLDRGRLSPP